MFPQFTLAKPIVCEFKKEQSSVEATEYDSCYVFSCTASKDESTVAATLSNNSVQVYDSNIGTQQGLVSRCVIPSVHKGRINDLVFAPQHRDGQVIVTCGQDGAVNSWDTRIGNNKPVFHIEMPNCGITSIDLGCGGMLIAAGTEAVKSQDSKILFWDMRSAALLGEYKESHSDVITQVRFCPADDTKLATSSLDGLACWFNTTISGEEEALQSVLNCESSISKIGFFGPNSQCLYSQTYTETFSLWHLEKAHRMAEFQQVRDSLGAVADYLIDCAYYEHPDGTDQHLVLASGSFKGEISLNKVSLDGIHPIGRLLDPGLGGHKAPVRTVCFLQQNHTTGVPMQLLSGGEDATLCQWVSPEAPQGTTPPGLTAQSVTKSNQRTLKAKGTSHHRQQAKSNPY